MGANVAGATAVEIPSVLDDPMPASRIARAHRLAARCHGVITADELRGLGFSRAAISRHVQNGQLTRLHPGVFGVAGHPRTWMHLVAAASRWAADGSAIAHRCAGAIWAMDGISQGPIELVTTRRLYSDDVNVRRVRSLPGNDLRRVNGIRVTSPERTLVDLCACIPLPALEQALDDCIRRGLVHPGDLEARLEVAAKGRKGTAALRTLLRARDPGSDVSESRLERRVLSLLARSGLPAPLAQFEIRSTSRFIARVDFAYPESRLAIEADGYRYHHGRTVWAHDLARRSELAAMGWRVLHVTWDDVERRPEEIAELVRQALRT